MASNDTRSAKAIHPSEAQRVRHMDIGTAMKDRSNRAWSALASRSVDGLHARRFAGISRPYTSADVERLRGSVCIAYTLAEMGAKRLRELLHTEDYVPALGALTGNQAVQMVR